ncbi:MAG: SAM-dependent methyltransferase [Candidatus Thiodiazotropha taylori]|nr:SAM-dependent methyltransferase [Candidatus Thiodiazotropha taylori]MCW4224053.1 SAM-dependent methyltransferase [Candidatus Thiodiazotropha endolucinida]MCG7885630.1 SAM-dependent methyltransferase [Candidatus Thiodiazotropha taylori]MCG7889635.1 SAM-dependent methyltransferase [Candidatus Thiodiazotropha taylori]MCG8035316.1 SAM-dependent methyltransferase [Candidatus Thiodiazotropha taylori]
MQKNKPSRTAYKVALGIVTLGSKPGMDRLLPPGIVEATEKLLVASGVVGSRAVQWSRSKRMVSVYEAFDWILPGQFEALAERKAFCEHQVREGIDQGASQILVIGAGYDTIGWRLAPEFPGVNFFEVDHPATARLKVRGIEAMGHRDNLLLIAEDLGERKLEDVLKSNELWDSKARTVIIAEGLVMYLHSDAVRSLFYQCALVTGVGTRIAFSYIPSGADGRPDAGRWTGLMLWLQKVAGEPWIWSIAPEEIGEFLENTGWKFAPGLAGTSRKYGVEFYAVATR